MQHEIPLQPRPYTEQEVRACRTMTDALRLSMRVSSLTPDELREEMGIDSGHWSRIFGGKAHFPHDRLIEFMERAGNDIPLDWQAWKRGKGTVLLEDEKDRQIRELQAQLEAERIEREAITKFMREVRERI